MKFLLTSAGIQNPSIRHALLDSLGKPIAECHALCIPTAGWGHPMMTPESTWRFVSGREPRCPMTEIGWKSVGVLELTALPSLPRTRWEPWVRQADVLLANGGDAVYLAHWMRQSGLADLLPTLAGQVWVGLSAGSMVMAPRVGQEFVEDNPAIAGDDRGLGWVDFAIFPHLAHPDLPWNTLANARKWAQGVGVPAYAIDDQTAIRVVDGKVDVVSEGEWIQLSR